MVLWLNAFPLKSGVSVNLSPRELVIRHKLDFAKHCRAQFGSYCKVHDEPMPTNSMTTRTTPAIVLGPTGNLQGTYNFFSLETGKKIKRRKFTPYPMPDLVIRCVEEYGNNNALSGIFDFADRSGVLFEWNKEVNECPEGIFKEEDIILYPSLTAELPGVVLGRDMPPSSIEVDLIPQGCVEDKAAQNASHEPFSIVGVNQPVTAHAIIHAKNGEINSNNDEDDDDGIIAINDAPVPRMAQDPLVLPDLSEDESEDNSNNSNDGKDDDDDAPFIDDAAVKQAESGDDEDEEQENQGVRQSRRRNKGANHQYDNCTLMMLGRHAAQGGQRHATILDGVCFFLAEDLSNAKPVPEADREEYTLGIALVIYGIGPGKKKFQERGEAGVTKELMQMHNMDVFHPVMRDDLTCDKRKKALASERSVGQGTNVRGRARAARGLVQAGHNLTYCFNQIGGNHRGHQHAQRARRRML